MNDLTEWLDALRDSDKIILVEGKKDKAALEHFGITKVRTLYKKPLFQIIEEIAEHYDEVILLTDLDKEGKLLYGKLSRELQHKGIKIDTTFREFLQKNTKLSHIEGLVSYCQKMSIKTVKAWLRPIVQHDSSSLQKP